MLSDWADLVRLPSVLTVPGDVLLGTLASGSRRPAVQVTAARCAGSCLVYLGAMALNDYADRDIDARERPSRPIPSGRIPPGHALAAAVGLTAAGLAASRAAGGRGSPPVAATLAGTAWAYDLGLKHTPLGPPALAAARFLDVMHGAAPSPRRALPAGAVMAVHVLGLGLASRHEAEGGAPWMAHAALAGTAAVSAAALAVSVTGLRRRPRGWERSLSLAVSLGSLGAFAGGLVRASAAAAARPGPAEMQRMVGAGVLGLVPLQASMLASAGPLRVPVTLVGAWLAARRLARHRPVT